ncbi:MAG: MBG domain-containing protein, partial [Actinomycetota bacterium]|nr:MBG domain-containing protein [Actinomycetota bacterium]
YPSNAKKWGDIIPGGDTAGDAFNGANNMALNWTTAGKAFFPGGANASYCGRMTAQQFYDSEIAAGESVADIVADLNAQGANEDVATLAALGGSFTTSNVATSGSAVTATTNAASSVTSTGATLNGSLTVGTTSTKWQFEYGTSSTLASGTTLTSLSATGVTGSSNSVLTALTGLSNSTTYYFRVLGVTNAGTDTEGILYGSILSFTTASSGASAQTISFTGPGAKIFGDAAVTVSATATSGLAVSFTSLTTGVCTVSGSTVTIVAAGSCSIRASQAGGTTGGTTYSAAADVDQSFTVNPKAVTVTANNKSKTSGAADPTFDATVSGLVGSDALGSFTYTFAGTGGTSYSSSATVPSAVGDYSNTPSGGSFTSGVAGNYSVTYTAGTYTIRAPGASAQTISFTGPGTKIFGDAAVTVSATASSGLA